MIQDKASICRYCHKQVKGVWFRRTLVVVLIVTTALSAYVNRQAIGYGIEEIRLFFRDIDDVWNTFKDALNEIKESITTLRNYHTQRESQLLQSGLGRRNR